MACEKCLHELADAISSGLGSGQDETPLARWVMARVQITCHHVTPEPHPDTVKQDWIASRIAFRRTIVGDE